MPQKAMGTTISFQQHSETVRIGALRSISEIKADSEAIDVTTPDAAGGCKQYIQGLKDPGEVTLEGFLESADAGQSALRALYLSGALVPFTVPFPDETAVSFSAFVKSFSLGAAQVDGAVGFSAVLRLSGGVTAA